MNHTTIEQSKVLIEAGLNPDTADMLFVKQIRDTDEVFIPELRYDEKEDVDIPCWSTGALINILPSEIHIGETKDFTFSIEIRKNQDGILD